jgi:hypothetical protein
MAALVPSGRQTVQTAAMLDAAETSGKSPVKVDEEGSAKVVESKTRFIAPLVAYVLAVNAADGGEKGVAAGEASSHGRSALGGASGLGLIGAVAAQSSRTFGAVLGFYGLGWSVYSNIISRGTEVEFNRNAAIDVRFGSRSTPAASKFMSSNTRSGLAPAK